MSIDQRPQADEVADADSHSPQAHWRTVVHAITGWDLWQHPVARVAAVVFSALLIGLVISVPLDLQGQILFSVGSFGAALLLSRTPGRLSTLAMIVLSISASSRYIYWRFTDTIGFTNWLDRHSAMAWCWLSCMPLRCCSLATSRRPGPCSAARFPCPRTSAPGPATRNRAIADPRRRRSGAEGA